MDARPTFEKWRYRKGGSAVAPFAHRHRVAVSFAVAAVVLTTFLFTAEYEISERRDFMRRDAENHADSAARAWRNSLHHDSQAVQLFATFWRNSERVTEDEFMNFTAVMLAGARDISSVRVLGIDRTVTWTWPPGQEVDAAFAQNRSWDAVFERARVETGVVISQPLDLPSERVGHLLVVGLRTSDDPLTLVGYGVGAVPVENLAVRTFESITSSDYAATVKVDGVFEASNGVTPYEDFVPVDAELAPSEERAVFLSEPALLVLSPSVRLYDAEIGSAPMYGASLGLFFGILAGYGTWRGIGFDQERALARERTARSEAHYRDLFENAGEMILVVDDENIVVDVNPRTEQILGYSAHVLEQRSILDIVAEGDREEVAAALDRFRVEETAQSIEWTFVTRVGARVDVYGTFTLTVGETGILLQAHVADVTRLKELEANLRSMNDALGRKVRELDSFAYSVAHDLKNPIRGVTAAAEYLDKDEESTFSDDAREYLRHVIESAERMRRMVEAMLLYARAGGERYPFEPVDSKGLVREAVSDVRELIDERGADVSTRGAFPALDAQAIPMKQVFVNLIANAIRHNEKESPRVIIESRATASGGAEFAIHDDGPGVPATQRERVFELFQRGGARIDDESTGVGLAIVKRIVEQHGGEIRVEDSDLGGATFRFTVPARRDVRGLATRGRRVSMR